MRKLYLNKRGYFVLVCIMLVGLMNAQERVYVTTDGDAFTSVEAHNSWANATSDVQAAIHAVAEAGGGEVWLGSGTYYPTENYYNVDPTDPLYDADEAARSFSFMMRDNVSIIGGFNGEENPGDRANYGYQEANATILSGDIGVENDDSDNAYHVVYGNDKTANSAMLSDVVITKGFANGTGRNSRGGGIQTRDGGTYTNITLVDNEANKGGGVYAYRGGIFTNCTFLENVTRVYNSDEALAGGIYLHLGNPIVTDCIFNYNRSEGSGGAICSTSGEVESCVMINNFCGSKGGAVYSYPSEDEGVPTNGGTFRNCLIANNTSWEDAGGLFSHGSGIWINCTVVNNYAETSGGGVYGYDGAEFTNLVIWGNICRDSEASNEVRFADGGAYTNCAVGGLTDLTVGTDMLSLNLVNTEADGPQFTAPSATYGRGENTTEREQYMLADWQFNVGSPLTDMGVADISALGLGDDDLADNDRVIQDRIDIGAYELLYYRASILSTGNGSVSQAGPIDLKPGGSLTLDFTPDANYQIHTFTVNDVDRLADLVEDTGVFTFTDSDVQSNLNIAVEFISLTAYDIDVSGDVGGDVSPEGITTVFEGLDFSLDLDPSNGYGLRSVMVDGVEEIENVVDNGDGTYTYDIIGVASAHTIVVDFALIHTVTINLSEGGMASHEGDVQILEGNTINLTLTRDEGYKLKSLLRATVESIGDVIDNNDGTYNYLISGVTGNLTIEATFDLFNTATVSASMGGTVSNIGVNELLEEESLVIDIEPGIGYKFTQISANGLDVMADVTANPDGTYSYEVSALTADVTIDVVFTKFEVLSISAGTGGVTNPMGDTELLEGEELAVLITPEANYRIGSVMLQGVDVTSQLTDNTDGTYTYIVNDLTEASMLEVQFIHFNVLTITGGSGGALSHEGAYQIDDGGSLEITITPDEGNYRVGSVILQGVDVTADVTDNTDGTYTYIVSNLTEASMLEVQFVHFNVLTVTAGSGGALSHEGAYQIDDGGSLEVTITPDEGNYRVGSVTLQGVDVTADVTDNTDGTYTYIVSNLTEASMLEVQFIHFNVLTITAGSGGALSHEGAYQIDDGGSLELTITPDEGNYRVGSLVLQGIDVTAGLTDNMDGTYTYIVSDLTEAALLQVQFIHFNVVTIVAGNGGALSHEGDQQIDDGESLEVTITPEAGNVVGGITLGGVDRLSDLSENGDGSFIYLIQGLTEDAVLDVRFSLATVVDELNAESAKFYPVPADSEIRSNVEISNVRVYNATGSLVKALDNNSMVKSITVSDLPDGVYLIRYTTQSGASKVEKVLIKH
ncbi:InlB B-repeat-containing protein [Carboxylicivirga sp. RSCT41]|uniref:InlB B-repeat-containing protein n=1 Tax=Carboxylicivirga agarovorans TaxID=3417570 RepID=UPI003D350145